MNAHPATAQETAAEYLDAGLWQDGTDVLLQMTAAAPDKSKIHPMAYYYLGYFAGKLGQPQRASEYYGLAKAMPPDYVFPFQNEEIDVLRQAMRANPRDARAPYYLGNLLYDWQPEEATQNVGSVRGHRPVLRDRPSEPGHGLHASEVRQRSQRGHRGTGEGRVARPQVSAAFHRTGRAI